MKRRAHDSLALAAVGAGISLTFVILAYYIPTIKVSLNGLAALGVLLPLCRGYYKEASLSAISVIIIGLFIVNIKILPFALVGGLYTVLTVFFVDKKWKYIFVLPFKIAYAAFTFFVFYKLATIITFDFSKMSFLPSNLSSGLLYFLLTLVWCIAFLIYDYVLISCYFGISKWLDKN